MLHERIFHKGTPHSNVYPEFSIMLLPKDSYKSLILWIEISCLKVQLRIQDMLQPKSSSGLDNISCRLSKHISDVIAIPLTSLINQSLQSGIFSCKFLCILESLHDSYPMLGAGSSSWVELFQVFMGTLLWQNGVS